MRKLVIITLFVVLAQFNSYGQFKTVGYVPNWNGPISLTNFSNNFNFWRVTHINIAFINPTNSTGILRDLEDEENYLISKAHENGVKVLLSLGGGNASENATTRGHYFTLINSTNRSAFCSYLKNYALDNNLDGLDIDLEGPAINSDYGAFIQVLSDSIKPSGLLLTSALSQGYGGANVPNSTFAYFDWINIMAYDATGSWGAPGNHSSYQLAVDALNYWKGRGLVKEKAILGLPFYGYGFNQSGAYTGNYPYKEIAADYPDAVYDDEAGSTIYYNGINTIIDKTSLAMVEGGGVMIWELSNDAPGEASLLLAINSITSNEKAIEKEMFSIYPNPTTGIFNVSGLNDGETSLVLYNTMGEQVEAVVVAENVNIAHLPKGVYHAVITRRKQTVSKKIVVF